MLQNRSMYRLYIIKKSGDRMRKKKKRAFLSPNDEVFFLQFYESYESFIVYYARKRSPPALDYEDIVQDTVLRLLANISTIRELNHPQLCKYLSLTVLTAVLDAAKRMDHETTVPLDEEMLDAVYGKAADQTDAVTVLSAKLEVERLKKDLPARDWLVLEGKYIQGYSQEELGAMLGIRPDSIRTILVRARQKSRDILLNVNQKGGNAHGY